jgi:hypothetical protein
MARLRSLPPPGGKGTTSRTGYRFGWWHYGAGIATLANVFWVAAGAAAVCAVAVVLAAMLANARCALVMGLAGLAIAGVTAWVPYDLRMNAKRIRAFQAKLKAAVG